MRFGVPVFMVSLSFVERQEVFIEMLEVVELGVSGFFGWLNTLTAFDIMLCNEIWDKELF